MGHIHENAARNDVREDLNTEGGQYKIKLKQIHMAITGTYKEEYGEGLYGLARRTRCATKTSRR
jgi:hypothetical protein